MKKIYLSIAFSSLVLFGYAQNALDFDGSNDYVQTSFGGVTGTANRTFEAWIYLSASPTSNMAISDYGLNTVGSRNTFYVNSNKQIGFISGGTNANISSSANAVPINQWTHVAFVLNSGTGYLYVNGTQVGTGNLSTVNTPSGNTNLRIGQRVPGGSIPFKGIIDEVRIWNVAKTATDLSNSMNGEFCSNPTGLVAYYKLNEGTAGGTNTGVTTAVDAVSANNGTLNNFSLSGSTSNWVIGKSLAASTQDSTTVTACDSYTSPSGNHTWTTSGNYIDTATTSTGCDSILFIDLTVLPNSSGSLTTTACNSYTSPSGNNTWTTSGTYTDILPNAVGCDSVITINLTINTVDTNILVNNASLTSWQAGANYQWLDCNNGYSAIPGATGQTFTATANGNYAVEIDLNGCVDTSACYAINGIGIDENPLHSVDIYPNPATDYVTITFRQPLKTCAVELVDLTGKIIFSKQFKNASKADVKFDLPAGIYVLKLTSEQYDVVKRLSIR